MSMKTWTCLVVAFVCFILLLIYFPRDNSGAGRRIKYVINTNYPPTRVEVQDGRRWEEEVLEIMKNNIYSDINEDIDQNRYSIVKDMEDCKVETVFYKKELKDYVPKDPKNMGEKAVLEFSLKPDPKGYYCVVGTHVPEWLEEEIRKVNSGVYVAQ
eukprot:49724_1